MKAVRAALLAAVVATGAGCARTVYTHLAPPADGVAHEHESSDRSSPQAWRHFFLFGWVPGELVIDGAHYCGGAEHVERIETRQSFVQGLIYQLAGYYINVYAPYTGRVVCDYHAGSD
jgi:hypothetical protein